MKAKRGEFKIVPSATHPEAARLPQHIEWSEQLTDRVVAVLKEHVGSDMTLEGLDSLDLDEIAVEVMSGDLAPFPRRIVMTSIRGVIEDVRKIYNVANRKTALAHKAADILRGISELYVQSTVYRELSGEETARLNRLLIEWDRLHATDPDTWTPEDGDLVAMLELMREVRDETLPQLREMERQEREQERRDRLEAARKPAVVMDGTRCSSCGRRPARVDDLCKRCAHAAGVMPHGKIGESL